MDVQPQGGADIGVAQQLTDAFHVHPPLHTPRGVAVPQAMEIPIPHTAALQQHLIAVLHRPRVRDDLPAGQQVAVRLLCLWLQHPQHLFWNGYPAFGIFRFRWLHRQARPAAYLRDALHRPLDVQQSRADVHVLPLQAAQLSQPQSGVGCQQHAQSRPVWAAQNDLSHLLQLRLGEHLHGLLPHLRQRHILAVAHTGHAHDPQQQTAYLPHQLGRIVLL